MCRFVYIFRNGERLKAEVLREILQVTECHAYYVNRLCFKLWSQGHLPTFVDIRTMWEQLVEEEFGAIANDLSSLTKNQRIVLQAICKLSVLREPNSDVFLNQVGLSARSVTLAINALEKTDHVELVKDGYRAIDPLAKYILNR